MDLEIIIPREVRKRKTNAFDITYMWSPKDGTREHIHDTGTDLQREQTCGCRGGGNNRQLGLGRCKQHIGWISNNVSLCSASNYIHYFPGGSEVKASASSAGDLGSIPGFDPWVQSLGREDPLEKGMATHSSILAWRMPWMEEPGRLQSTGSQRVGHG